jgi:predicted nucleotidyltransferase
MNTWGEFMTNKEIIETVKERLIKTYNLKEIYLFGSFAWGNPDSQSDLDLLIVVDKSDEKPYKRPIKGIKALFGLGIANDIIVFTKDEFDRLAGDVSTLCYKIKQERVKLYETI